MPLLQEREHLLGLRRVDRRRLAVGRQDAAAGAVEHLEEVDGQALVGLALEADAAVALGHLVGLLPGRRGVWTFFLL